MSLTSEFQSLFDVLGTAVNKALGGDLPLLASALPSDLDIFGTLKGQITGALASVDPSDPSAIAAALTGLSIPGLSATAAGDNVDITLATGGSASVDPDAAAIDVGTAGVGLAASADFEGSVNADLNLKLNFDTGTGKLAVADNGAGHELALGLELSADVSGSAQLGLLKLSVEDGLDTPEIKLDFGVDIAPGDVSGLTASSVSVATNGSAKLDLELATDVPILPKFYADLALDWEFGGTMSATPAVQFKDIGVDISSLLDQLADVMDPILGLTKDFPLGDVISAMTEPVPEPFAKILDFVDLDKVPLPSGDHQINLLDFAAAYYKFNGDEAAVEKLSLFAQAIAIIKQLTGGADDDLDGRISLGSFDVVGGVAQDFHGNANAAAEADGLLAAVGQFNELVEGVKGLINDATTSLKNGLSDTSGLSFPILDHPESIVSLFMPTPGAAPVTFVEYDIPALGFDVQVGDFFFPILGPIGIELGGALAANIDFKIAYDSKGLEDPDHDGKFTPRDLLEGLVLKPTTPGADVAFLNSEIHAGAGVSLVAVSAFIEGGLNGGLHAKLEDDELRYGAFADGGCIFEVSGQVGAELRARISIGFGPFKWTHSVTLAETTLADFTYGCDGHGETDPGFGLAHAAPDAAKGPDLFLHVGTLANLRSIGGQHGTNAAGNPSDPADTTSAETFRVANALDDDGHAIAGTLEVSAFGISERYGSPNGPMQKIKADLGEGHDALVIDEAVTQLAEVNGGNGDDYISGGLGKDNFTGAAGLDTLVGHGGDDKLYGGVGDDVLEGGAGADLLDGGADFDQVSYEKSPVGVIFNPTKVDGVDGFIGEGGDAEGDVLIGIEYIIGSNFDDQLHGNKTQANTLEGLSGDDSLTGGSQGDYLLGGVGADYMNGLGGRDATSYLTSFGAVRIDLLFNSFDGGDATGDVLVNMEDIQGSFFDDILNGNNSDNRLDGLLDSDTLDGRGGRDILTGGEGDDIVRGGADGDEFSGGAGIDLLTYEHKLSGVTVNLRTGMAAGAGVGQDRIGEHPAGSAFVLNNTGHSGFENLDGSNFGDNLTGDLDGNIIRGLNGNDIINGDGGNDVVVGGAGGDTLAGGDGIDLADYRSSFSGVNASLVAGVVGSGGDAQGDTLSGIENLRGSDLADVLTGNDGDNLIDPGLSLSSISPFAVDQVYGGGGEDTLFLDYSRHDFGEGMVGGFNGWFGGGSFTRENAGGTVLDGVNFAGIDKLIVVGTFKGDEIRGGGGDDFIAAGGGDDLVYGGIGSDEIYAAEGNDTVIDGTDSSRHLLTEPYGGEDASIITLDGGTGIDTLSISLVSEFRDVTITGGTPGEEFAGTNMTLADGSRISSFENLADVITGTGKDTVSQLGQVDNYIHTGWDTDIIRPGLGVDTVNGGFDFDLGVEVEIRSIDVPTGPEDLGGTETIVAPVVKDQALFQQNKGDLLELDYSSYAGPGGIVGTIALVESDIGLYKPDGHGLPIETNEGTYTGGDPGDPDYTHLDFTEIERIKVKGSDHGDTLVGTYDTFFGMNNGFASETAVTERGDDILEGRDGNDTLIGNTGEDKLYGGSGDDVLCGTKNPFDFSSSPEPETEVDQLYGGEGADLFVLGAGSAVFYKGFVISESSANRAIIEDFDAAEGDRIQLLGTSSDYRFDFSGTTAHVYYRDGSVPANDELIAEIKNAAGFDLGAGNVRYVTASDPFPTPPPEPLSLAAPLSTFAASGISGFSPLAANWVTQDNDPTDLLAALFAGGGGTGLKTLSLSSNGDGRAFGTFSGDPFGLGSGIVLSTGQVEDIAGSNESDGGVFPGFGGPPDLSTDLGLPGNDGDTISLTYTFEKEAGADVDTVVFDFVLLTEELREYAGSGFNDSFKITLNGASLATLSDGAAANVNNLLPATFGPRHPDLVLNPSGTGPASDSLRADAYTKTLHFAGHLRDGVNTLTIEVKDVLDGIYDSGILVKGGTLKAGTSIGGLFVGGAGAGGNPTRVSEGAPAVKIPITIDPGTKGPPTSPLTVTLTPGCPELDLGNGPGKAIAITIKPGDPLTFDLLVKVLNDGIAEPAEFCAIDVSVKSGDKAYDGLKVAPIVVEMTDPVPLTIEASAAHAGSSKSVAFGFGVDIRGFDLNGKAEKLAFGDGGLGVDGHRFGLPGERPFHDEVDYRGGKSERLELHFAVPGDDVAVTLGQFYATEAGRGELARYTAFDAAGRVIGTGVLDPSAGGRSAGANTWTFDLGLDGVSRLDLTGADLHRGAGSGRFQSDFNLHSLTYTPGTRPAPLVAINGTDGADLIDATHTPSGQPRPGAGDDLISGLGKNDKLFGLDGRDILMGGKGDDRLDGGGGDDLMVGAQGKDTIVGGAGRDSFLFNAKLDQPADKILGFLAADDTILLSHKIFKALPQGPLQAALFNHGGKEDDDDRILYKQGKLFYDDDGKGGDDPVVFAKLAGAPKLSELDFVVVA